VDSQPAEFVNDQFFFSFCTVDLAAGNARSRMNRFHVVS
jgi:hypothetical protein